MQWDQTNIIKDLLEMSVLKDSEEQKREHETNLLQQGISSEIDQKALDREHENYRDSIENVQQLKLNAEQQFQIRELNRIAAEKHLAQILAGNQQQLDLNEQNNAHNLKVWNIKQKGVLDQRALEDSLTKAKIDWQDERELGKSAQAYVAPTDLLRGSLGDYLGEEGGLLGLGWNESDMYKSYYGQQDMLSGQSPRDLMQSIHGDFKKMKMLGDEDNEQVKAFKKLVSDLYFKAAKRDYGKDFMDDWKGDTNVKGQAIFFELEKLMDELGINKVRSQNMPRDGWLSKYFDLIGGTERSDWGGY